MKAAALELARIVLERENPDPMDAAVALATAILEDDAKPGCKGAPKDMPPKPWKAVRVVYDQAMLFKIVSGESIVIEHRKLPSDAMQIGCRMNGTDLEQYVQSETYNAQSCLCSLPTLRINYSTGG